jgi:hypothetical protein
MVWEFPPAQHIAIWKFAVIAGLERQKNARAHQVGALHRLMSCVIQRLSTKAVCSVG